MKYKTILTVLIALCSCSDIKTKENPMIEKASIVEMVYFDTKENVIPEQAKEAITVLNVFLSKQEGFVYRTTSCSKEGKYLDLIYWTDMASAKAASEKAMKTPEVSATFDLTEEKDMIFTYFEIFNHK